MSRRAPRLTKRERKVARLFRRIGARDGVRFYNPTEVTITLDEQKLDVGPDGVLTIEREKEDPCLD
jgi:hypothetical protein